MHVLALLSLSTETTKVPLPIVDDIRKDAFAAAGCEAIGRTVAAIVDIYRRIWADIGGMGASRSALRDRLRASVARCSGCGTGTGPGVRCREFHLPD